MMVKDFDGWNESKKNIHNKEDSRFFHEREIWMLTIGLNVGFEQDGKGDDFLRPVLIIKKLNNRFFIGLPLTKSIKKSPHVVAVSDSSFAIFSQIRAFDSKRLLYRMETIPSFRFESIKQKLRDYL